MISNFFKQSKRLIRLNNIYSRNFTTTAGANSGPTEVQVKKEDTSVPVHLRPYNKE